MDTLSEAEETLWKRLAVFRGPFSLKDAQMICEDEAILDVPALLTSLVEQGLIDLSGQGGEAHYQMPETLRQEARRRLRSSHETSRLEERLVYYLALKAQLRPSNAGRVEWMDRLDREYETLCAVLRLWARSRRVDLGLQVLIDLYWFWLERHLKAGQKWFATFLSLPPTAAPYVRAEAFAELRADALEVASQPAVNKGLYFETDPATRQADYAQANALAEEALAIRRELGDRRGESSCLLLLSHFPFQHGDLAAARALLEDSLAIGRELANPQRITAAAESIGQIALAQGDFQIASARFQEALRAWLAFDEAPFLPGHPAGLLEGLAAATAGLDQSARALLLAGAAAANREVTNSPLSPDDQAELDRSLDSARRFLDSEAAAAAWREGRAMTLEEAISFALQEAGSDASAP